MTGVASGPRDLPVHARSFATLSRQYHQHHSGDARAGSPARHGGGLRRRARAHDRRARLVDHGCELRRPRRPSTARRTVRRPGLLTPKARPGSSTPPATTSRPAGPSGCPGTTWSSGTYGRPRPSMLTHPKWVGPRGSRHHRGEVHMWGPHVWKRSVPGPLDYVDVLQRLAARWVGLHRDGRRRDADGSVRARIATRSAAPTGARR